MSLRFVAPCCRSSLCPNSLGVLGNLLWSKLFAGLQVRESKVRRAGIGGRARLAGELRDMDDEVSSRHRSIDCLHLRSASTTPPGFQSVLLVL